MYNVCVCVCVQTVRAARRQRGAVVAACRWRPAGGTLKAAAIPTQHTIAVFMEDILLDIIKFKRDYFVMEMPVVRKTGGDTK
jgi:hypothetical protein